MRRLQYREWAPARFFFVRRGHDVSLQSEIEERLADASQLSRFCSRSCGDGTLRVFIDHPDGVTLALCERVTVLLADLRERYSLRSPRPAPRGR